ncbi:MAG: DUF1844 domain-containing protein [Bythopirellula sp.]
MSEEKKIIIDDDWKDQVAAEKEALKQEAETEEPAATDAPAPGEAPTEMPPASFEMLVTTLATEAMVALGQFPNPATQESTVSTEHATYAIDMLAMLKEKTKSNLTGGEDTMLTDLLHQLRMMFIAVQSQNPEA